jgi:hypothetical protein
LVFVETRKIGSIQELTHVTGDEGGIDPALFSFSKCFAFKRKKSIRFPSSLLMGIRTTPWEASHVHFINVLLRTVAFWPEEPAGGIEPNTSETEELTHVSFDRRSAEHLGLFDAACSPDPELPANVGNQARCQDNQP